MTISSSHIATPCTRVDACLVCSALPGCSHDSVVARPRQARFQSVSSPPDDEQR